MSTLFEKGQMGDVEVQNRVFMAPLTRNRAQPNGTPGEHAATYYAQRASAGLIISEAAQISAMGKGYINTPGIHLESHIAEWKRITGAVHEKGGKIFIQLWHVGRISHTSLLPEGAAPLAPSAIKADAQTFTQDGPTDVSEPKEMSLQDIKDTIADYKAAAQNAKKAGFDGIELHAANGYLIDQFLNDKSNRRSDEYGGSADNKPRFLMEALDAVLSVWEPSQVGLRLSPTGHFNDMKDNDPLLTYGTAIEKVNPLSLAYLHMVEKFPGMDVDCEEQKILTELRHKWNGFYISNGGYDEQTAQKAVEIGYADAVAFGRPFISNPDLPRRLEIGAELAHADESTFYGGGAEGYIDYPTLEESKAS